MQEVQTFLKADNGKLSKVIQYATGTKVEIPINKDGSVCWYIDKEKNKES